MKLSETLELKFEKSSQKNRAQVVRDGRGRVCEAGVAQKYPKARKKCVTEPQGTTGLF